MSYTRRMLQALRRALLGSVLLVCCTSAESWAQRLPTGGATSVLVDPNNVGTLYVGAGTGVFKSADGGQTWANTAMPYSSLVDAMILDPSDSSTIYVAARGRSYVTTDAGQTWNQLNAFCAWSFAAVPTTPTTLYTGVCNGGPYVSTDGGQTWVPANTGIGLLDVFSFAVDPTNQSTIYAGTNNGIYKSTDSGASWTFSASGPNSRVTAFAIDPVDSNNLWAASWSGIFKSSNAGQSWFLVVTGVFSDIIFDPFTSSNMYASVYTADSFLKSTDNGQTWVVSNSGLPTAPSGVFNIAADPSNECALYTATSRDSAYSSVDCGATWIAS